MLYLIWLNRRRATPTALQIILLSFRYYLLTYYWIDILEKKNSVKISNVTALLRIEAKCCFEYNNLITETWNITLCCYIAKRQRHRLFCYWNVRVVAEDARVRQKLYKWARQGYKSFKPRQTGRSTGYPVSSGCSLPLRFSPPFRPSFIYFFSEIHFLYARVW